LLDDFDEDSANSEDDEPPVQFMTFAMAKEQLLSTEETLVVDEQSIEDGLGYEAYFENIYKFFVSLEEELVKLDELSVLAQTRELTLEEHQEFRGVSHAMKV
jgi:hypothetical protein